MFPGGLRMRQAQRLRLHATSVWVSCVWMCQIKWVHMEECNCRVSWPRFSLSNSGQNMRETLGYATVFCEQNRCSHPEFVDQKTDKGQVSHLVNAPWNVERDEGEDEQLVVVTLTYCILQSLILLIQLSQTNAVFNSCCRWERRAPSGWHVLTQQCQCLLKIYD